MPPSKASCFHKFVRYNQGATLTCMKCGASRIYGTPAGIVVLKPDEPAALKLLPASSARKRGRPVDPISEGDIKMVKWLADGLTRKQIAEKLGVPDCKQYINTLCRRLDVPTPYAAVAKALREKLIR